MSLFDPTVSTLLNNFQLPLDPDSALFLVPGDYEGPGISELLHVEGQDGGSDRSQDGEGEGLDWDRRSAPRGARVGGAVGTLGRVSVHRQTPRDEERGGEGGREPRGGRYSVRSPVPPTPWGTILSPTVRALIGARGRFGEWKGRSRRGRLRIPLSVSLPVSLQSFRYSPRGTAGLSRGGCRGQDQDVDCDSGDPPSYLNRSLSTGLGVPK